MGLERKSVLLMIEDEALLRQVRDALSPLLRVVVATSKPADAEAKLELQSYDAVVYRSQLPTIETKDGLFECMRGKAKAQPLPKWIVLGRDVEPSALEARFAHLSFLDAKDDCPGLIRRLESVLATPRKDRPLLDVTFLNPLVTALIEVIQGEVNIKLWRESPILRAPDRACLPTDLSATLVVRSERLRGSLALGFSESLALSLQEKITGSRGAGLSDPVLAAIARDSALKVVDRAKRELGVLGYDVTTPAPPQIVAAPAHVIQHPFEGACLCLPFGSPQGRLTLEFAVAPDA